ncbi:MAG: hypothetical protein H6553_11180 [Chitinophagales bacterium]|nr:hypothetical protein [Chitinophagales bacterium]
MIVSGGEEVCISFVNKILLHPLLTNAVKVRDPEYPLLVKVTDVPLVEKATHGILVDQFRVYPIGKVSAML